MSLFEDLRKKATDALTQALDERPELKQAATKAAADLQEFGHKAAEELNKRAPALKEALTVGAQKAVEAGKQAAEKAAEAIPPAIEQLKDRLSGGTAKAAAKETTEQK